MANVIVDAGSPALIFPGGLFALAFGLALKGADRRVGARLQGRIGPPLAQPFFDLVKLGFKRMIAPSVACEPVFFGDAADRRGFDAARHSARSDCRRLRAPTRTDRRPIGPALFARCARRRADGRRDLPRVRPTVQSASRARWR